MLSRGIMLKKSDSNSFSNYGNPLSHHQFRHASVESTLLQNVPNTTNFASDHGNSLLVEFLELNWYSSMFSFITLSHRLIQWCRGQMSWRQRSQENISFFYLIYKRASRVSQLENVYAGSGKILPVFLSFILWEKGAKLRMNFED